MNMSFEEFEKVVKSIKDISLKVEWEIGGVSGGGYWSDAKLESYTVDGPTEPKKTELFKILKKVYPDISALLLFEIDNSPELYYYSNYEDRSDYYGNETHYKTRELNLNVLYDILKE